MFKSAVIAATVAAALVSPALASDPRVNIINRSDYTVTRIEMSHVRTSDWGRDLLGDHILRTGYYLDLVTPGIHDGYCRYDLRVTFSNGVRMEVSDFNACATETVAVYNYGFAFTDMRDRLTTRRGVRYSS